MTLAAEEATSAAEIVAVEDDMHELMEYVFQPTYGRLKASIAALAGEQANWKAIKSDSLILAEAANLLIGRGDGVELWQIHAVETRQTGATLYAAAKARDAQQTRASFISMLARCNACLQDFADGEYQLEP